MRNGLKTTLTLFFFIKTCHLSCQKGSERKNTRATIHSLSRLSLKPRKPPAITFGHFLQSAMARTRGAKSSFPFSCKRVAQEAPVQGSTSEPPRQVPAPPPAKPASLSPPARRYQTRLGGRPPQKKARVADSEPIDLTEPSPEPSPAPSSEPPAEPQSPIEGNLDCRARPFHSELCFDTATFRLQPELVDSFHLLHRYRMEHLLTPRDFLYPRVATDFYQSMTTNQVKDLTLIHFTIDGRYGVLGAHHIVEALHIPYEPARLEDYRVWTNPSQLEMVHLLSRGTSTNPYLLRKELPPSMFFINALCPARVMRGYFFGPHHLIMAALLYFEEKVHRKKLLRANAIPLLFLRLLCQILEHLGYPSDPQLECKRICREPSTSAEPRMVIPISEYKDLCHTLQTLTATQSSLAQEMLVIRSHQEQILTTQTQHTAILRQLQHHLGLPSATEHLIPTTTEPYAPFEPTTEDAETFA
ncbi:hypothetical protein AAG906_011210 [Vitis piasezkii]